MRLVHRMGFGIFIMAVTVAEIGLVVVQTVNAVVVFSSLACSTNHTIWYGNERI